jgi:hypothetical protein
MMRFGLVPGGNSSGTIRLYEVLEAGANSRRDLNSVRDAAGALGKPPFVMLDNWSQLPAFMRVIPMPWNRA